MTDNTNETLVDLIRNAPDQGDKTKYLTELYENNYLYILKICKKFSGYEDVDDLMQESFFGLRIAVDKYDQDQGIPFINYAGMRIEGSLIRYIQNCGSVVRLPVWVRNNIIKYEKAAKVFLQEKGREPSDQELADILSWTIAQLKRVKERAVILHETSLDTVISADDDSFTFKDVLIDPEDRYEELTDQMDAEQKERDVWSAVDLLDDRKAEIIKKRYKDNMVLKDIGLDLGITAECVRQHENKALKLLSRSKMIRMYADEYLSGRAYSGVSLSSFKKTGTSATERTAIESIDRTINKYMRKTERRVKRAERDKIRELNDVRQKIEC